MRAFSVWAILLSRTHNTWCPFIPGYFVKSEMSKSEDSDLVEYDSWRVAENYIKTWFTIDVVSGVPFAAIELIIEASSSGGVSDDHGGSSTGALSSAKSAKLLRFLKLGRLLKIEKILSNLDREMKDNIEDFIDKGSTRSASMLLKLTLQASFLYSLSCH